MIEKNLHLARYYARLYAKRTSHSYDDLLSDGYWGLVLANKCYQRSRGAKFSSYARRRVQGTMIDRFRKKTYENRAIIDEDLVELRTPQSLFEKAEQKRKLRLALLKLDSRQRAVLWLYYFADFTLSEAGELLNISEAYTCMLKREAHKNLRKALEDENHKSREIPIS